MKRIYIAVNAEELRAIRVAAANADLSVPAWARLKLLELAGIQVDDLADRCREAVDDGLLTTSAIAERLNVELPKAREALRSSGMVHNKTTGHWSKPDN